jgi:putative intracellular protease/amidase
MKVAVFLFNGITPLDAIGPCDALARLPDVSIEFCATRAGMVRSQDGFVGLQADRSLNEVQEADVLLVPGGSREGLGAVLADQAVLGWVAKIHEGTAFTTSVCTGSLILSAAGVTKGQQVATHWRAKDFLSRFGARYSSERVTRSGKLLTAAGVTAGIDLGLTLCGLIAGPDVGAAVELSMEYCPAPPFGGKRATDAPASLVETVGSKLRG